ncbi:hypothetical protein KP509_06G066100 [Ceratopteris richardii]|uniref:DUF4378 domain-containing protein n=1 Tax=Ceratopteris richardii TaxID=49495 RepID=A0A8T2UPK1_CERRI|nr:hypothetical protein KP509_06G066100 [Ceratopteris richardii]
MSEQPQLYTSKLMSTLSSSAASSCSSEQYNLKKGSCTGIFFQIFDWNHRLHKKQRARRKSLPAERPSPTSISKATTKESIQGLDCQDPNIDGGIPSQPTQDPLQQGGQTSFDKKTKKRSSNVVAKLMGLETMPSPDFRREKRSPSHIHQEESSIRVPNFGGRSPLSSQRIPPSRRSLLEIEKNSVGNPSSRRCSKSECLSEGSLSKRYLEELSDNNGESSKVLSQSGPLVQEGNLACILSPSNAHNKLILPVKRSPASKTRVCLFENPNRSTESKNTQKQFTAPFRRISDGDNENEDVHTDTKEAIPKESHSSGLSSRLHQQKNIFSFPYKPSDTKYFNPVSNLQQAKQRENTSSSSLAEQQQAKQGISRHEDVGPSKCHQSQSEHTNDRGKVELGRICVRRRERSSRNQEEFANLKVQNCNASRHKVRATSFECLDDSSESMRVTSSTSSYLTESSNATTSSFLTKNMRVSNDCKHTIAKSGKSDYQQKTESVSKKYLLKRTGDPLTSKGRVPIINDLDRSKNSSMRKPVSVKDIVPRESTEKFDQFKDDSILYRGLFDDEECSRVTVDESILSVVDSPISTSVEILSDSCFNMPSFGSNNTIDESNSNESSFCEEEDSGKLVDTNIRGEDCSQVPAPVEVSSNVSFGAVSLTTECGLPYRESGGSCMSLRGEISDMARPKDFDGTHKRKLTVSYSGKPTAVILQELFAALNLSTKLSIGDGHPSDMSDAASSSTRSESCRVTERLIGEDSSLSENSSFRFMNGYGHCGEGDESLSIRGLMYGACSKNEHHTDSDTQGKQQAQTSMYEWNERNGTSTVRLRADWQSMSKLNKYIFESEEDYVRCIIRNASMSSQDTRNISINMVRIDSALFEELEMITEHKWECKGTAVNEIDNRLHFDEEWREILARSNRKLIFDCIQEALNLDMGISMLMPSWNCRSGSADLRTQICYQKVMKHLNNWKTAKCTMNVDDLVEKAMNTGNEKWNGFFNDIPTLAEQLGDDLADDLINELVRELIPSPCHQQGHAGRRGSRRNARSK